MTAMNQSGDQMFDLTQLRQSMGNDPLFIGEMVRLFVSQCEEIVAEINLLKVQGNAERIRFLLHRMKPSLSIMGMPDARELVVNLEYNGITDTNDPRFAAPLETMLQMLVEVAAHLKALDQSGRLMLA